MATHLMQTDESTFQWPNTSVYHTSAITDLSTWHARLGHLNLIICRAFLKRLDVSYSDNVNKDWYCSSCELGKATKIYNRTPQERAIGIFQKVHSDLVGPIKPAGLLEEQYFFTFTCDASRYTHEYTGIKKSEWFDHLLTYYSLAQNKTGKSKANKHLRTDFGTELRSLKSDDWFLKEGITFEPSTPYSQEQNGVSERTGRTIMDMTRCTIIAGGIPDYLWTEVVLAMVHTKNVRPTNAVNRLDHTSSCQSRYIATKYVWAIAHSPRPREGDSIRALLSTNVRPSRRPWAVNRLPLSKRQKNWSGWVGKKTLQTVLSKCYAF